MIRQEIWASNQLPYPIGSSVTSRDNAGIKNEYGRRHKNRNSGAKPASLLIGAGV